MKNIPPVHPPFISLIVAAVLLCGLSACQSIGLPSAPVAPENRILLQPHGPQQGQADTGDLVIDYTYELGAEPDRRLQVAGGVQSARQRWDVAKIYLLLLDDSGRAIAREVLFASGYRNLGNFKRPPVFDTTLSLPPGTTAMAFSSFVQVDQGHR